METNITPPIEDTTKSTIKKSSKGNTSNDTGLPSDKATNVQQFNWISNWLTKNNLHKTLDCLLEEYSAILDQEGSLAKVPKIQTSPPLTQLQQTINVHGSSVLSVRFHRTKPWIVSSDSSKHLIVSSLETGNVLATDKPFLGAVISLDMNPVYPNLFIIGTMDENHGLFEIKEHEDKVIIETHKKWHAHEKYVIRVKWAPDGKTFATASHDQSVIFWRLNDARNDATEVKKLNFSGIVEANEWTKDGKNLIASIKENAFLQYIHVDTWEISLANVNELGDEYVSFTILELKLSQDGSQLLASTDMSRAIMFRQGSEAQVRNFYGYECDGYGQPRTIFDSKGMIYMTSQDFKIYIYDINSGLQIDNLALHGAFVRDLDYHPDHDLLASGSYDKTIKIWKRPPIK